MDCLVKSEFTGSVAWLGRVPHASKNIRSETTGKVDTTFEGICGETHSGLNRPSCVRVTMLYPKGTVIKNTRQISVLSAEEIAEIAAQMGLDNLDPSWFGASIVVKGFPDFTHIPPGSRLQTSAGTTLTVDLENAPCNLPAREIENEHPGFGKAFKAAAMGRRGITAWVERPGPLAVGDTVSLFTPTQRGWNPK